MFSVRELRTESGGERGGSSPPPTAINRKMNFLTLSQKKPINMEILDNNDDYVITEVNLDGVVSSEPMKKDQVVEYLNKRYGDLSIKHINESSRLKIIHLKSGEWKRVKISVDLI